MTVIEKLDHQVANTKAQLDDMLDHLSAASDPALLNEARARVQAARAWAKAHGKAKALRLDLLRVEVEALVQLAKLGALDGLSSGEKKAAEFLANMTREAREAFVNTNSTATTAAGMCRSVWREQEYEEDRRRWRATGYKMATSPEPPSDDGVERARERVYYVGAALSRLMETVEDRESFTIDDLASEAMREAGLDGDEAISDGIRHACRESVRRAPSLKVGETILPRFLTARSGDDSYIRIPIENALMSHLDDDIALREEQIKQDMAAVERKKEVRRRLQELGAQTDSRIGDVIAADIASAAA